MASKVGQSRHIKDYLLIFIFLRLSLFKHVSKLFWITRLTRFWVAKEGMGMGFKCFGEHIWKLILALEVGLVKLKNI